MNKVLTKKDVVMQSDTVSVSTGTDLNTGPCELRLCTADSRNKGAALSLTLQLVT